ncbi:tripartite tricarboxylate transporter permease [Paracoccus sp. Z330]|uniref:Tripartite tricarboxylate transporter permease n=1 Tax=Paracoccus onchidii TaxID=3017813 RepID=A0ABT4ZDJ0_9RHOB|nr:tripartite tricarboxylate transporter permease [Paracoccus onchidii]MDB6177429.1 tripartite tricarboxylate transporter permease [Paracoccus onchidii]
MTFDILLAAIELVFAPKVLAIILAASVFGLFVGAIPGLTATMAAALMVPLTFFMDPVPAVSAIVAATAMAIFAGDIPGAMLRIPGTPASAAYVEDSYAMTRKGQLRAVLGLNLICSALGGVIGSIILMVAAPALAKIAMRFSSDEYFWLALLGLSCAVFIAASNPVKGVLSLLIGLSIAMIGFDPSAGFPRFSFGITELTGGVDFVPAMIGMFAIPEVIRNIVNIHQVKPVQQRVSHVFAGLRERLAHRWWNILRSSGLGTLIGALPGAGADIAAWVCYAVSKKLSREPEKYGTGHDEGIIDATASNNAAVSGSWVPALVFGIPGGAVTAIAVGIMYMKGLNPGPRIFTETPEIIYAVLIAFLIANLIMVPLGYVAIRMAGLIIGVPRAVLMPIIMIFCMVGAFSITNSGFAIVIVLVLGLLAYGMEENGIPLAPAILGIVLGPLVERNFVMSMTKSGGDLLSLFDRPIAAVLGVATLAMWLMPALLAMLRSFRNGRA